jgi:hypothetical protein
VREPIVVFANGIDSCGSGGCSPTPTCRPLLSGGRDAGPDLSRPFTQPAIQLHIHHALLSGPLPPQPGRRLSLSFLSDVPLTRICVSFVVRIGLRDPGFSMQASPWGCWSSMRLSLFQPLGMAASTRTTGTLRPSRICSPGYMVFISGSPLGYGGAPVFNAPFELNGAIKLQLHDATVAGIPLAPHNGVECQGSRVWCYTWGSVPSARLGRAEMLNVNSGEVIRLTNAASCALANNTLTESALHQPRQLHRSRFLDDRVLTAHARSLVKLGSSA